MADLQADGVRARAAAHVDQTHRAARASQDRHHSEEAARLNGIREVEVRSFAANRDEAIDRHREAVRGIDAAEEHAFRQLHARQNSLRGRVSGLFKGRGHHERQREELAERFEARRMAQHRDLARLQERQHEAEQKARLRHAAEHKAMQERQQRERDEVAKRQEVNREREIGARAEAIQKARAHEQGRRMEQAFGHASRPPQHQQEPQATREAFGHAADQGRGHSR